MEEINRWSSEVTAGQVSDLVRQGDISGLTTWLIANVLYFKATWALPFPEQSSEGDFRLAGHRTPIRVRDMQQTASYRMVRNIHGFDALELPYVGAEFLAVCILPTEGNAAPWKEGVSQTALKELQQKLAEAEAADVDVRLPLFHVRSKNDLKTALQAMGVRLAFAAKADFRGLVEQNRFPVSEFLQDVDLAVTPKGTEASARTGGFGSGAFEEVEPLNFHADRPFLFLIVHRASGAVLFVGKVDDPRRR